YKPGVPALEEQRSRVAQISKLLDAELDATMRSVLDDKQAELREASAQVQSLQTSIATLRDKWSLAKENLEYSRLNREIATWDKTYQSLLEQLYSARVAEQNARREGAISVIQHPSDGERILLPTRTGSRRNKLPQLIA